MCIYVCIHVSKVAGGYKLRNSETFKNHVLSFLLTTLRLILPALYTPLTSATMTLQFRLHHSTSSTQVFLQSRFVKLEHVLWLYFHETHVWLTKTADLGLGTSSVQIHDL